MPEKWWSCGASVPNRDASRAEITPMSRYPERDARSIDSWYQVQVSGVVTPGIDADAFAVVHSADMDPVSWTGFRSTSSAAVTTYASFRGLPGVRRDVASSAPFRHNISGRPADYK